LDTPEDWGFLIGGGFAVFILMWGFGGFNFVNDQISGYQASKLTPYFGEDIYFTQTQLSRLQGDFNSYEVAFCGLMDGNQVHKLRVASIRYASEKEISYSCKPYEILDLHIHPSGLATPSDVDKEALKWQSKDGKTHISCIYGGGSIINCLSYDSGNFINHKVHIVQ
jgi:hypothetical protein